MINRTARLEDGSLLDYGVSINHPNQPPVNERVRMTVNFYGVKFIPIGPNRTQVTYVSSTDSMGGLPAMAVNSSQSGRAADIGLAAQMADTFPQLKEEAKQELNAIRGQHGFEPLA